MDPKILDRCKLALMLRARAETAKGTREVDLTALREAGRAQTRRVLVALSRKKRLRCPACKALVRAELGDLGPWRFSHAAPSVNCPLEASRRRDLVVHALVEELLRSGHERLMADVSLPGPRGEVLWTPLAARRKGIVRVFDIWEEAEPLEDAQHRTRLHEAMGREVVWVLLGADPHGAFIRWLYDEARAHYVAVVEAETLA